ncbi:MAG: SRPBCC family protein [Salinisphaeraceae bacterium]
MPRSIAVLFAAAGTLMLGACSAGDSSLSASQSATINAPAADVWETIGDFGDLDGWHPAVESTEITTGTNNEPGAQRLLTLGGDGGTVTEELQAYDADGMSYTYTIVEGVLPVADYQATITVMPAGDNSSNVSWSGTFNAAGADDATATETINGVYKAGLDNLKGMFAE